MKLILVTFCLLGCVAVWGLPIEENENENSGSIEEFGSGSGETFIEFLENEVVQEGIIVQKCLALLMALFGGARPAPAPASTTATQAQLQVVPLFQAMGWGK